MALLHVLHALAPEFGWKLSVAHFNHQLRGRSSNADERLVRATARRLKLACDVASDDVRAVAAKRGISIEMAGRELRHAFFAKCARRRRARVVTLAHHADDQVELFFLRLLRGAGAEGLGGMKPSSASPEDGHIELTRPFLGFGKEEIAAFAREARVCFREDASNGSTEFDRNWIRHELLPLLRERQPGIGKTIFRVMQITGAEADFVKRAAEDWLKKAKAASARFAHLPIAVQRRLIQMQLRALGVEPDFQLVDFLRAEPGRKVSVGAGVQMVCDSTGRVRRVVSNPVGFSPRQQVIEFSKSASSRRGLQGRVEFDSLRFTWRIVRCPKSFSPVRKAGLEFFDADRVGARVVLRHWRAGDRFQPIGLPAPTKLQDWFTNRKIPVARRRRLILAETERGEVFWVEEERIGEAAKVTAATRRLLEFKWKQL